MKSDTTVTKMNIYSLEKILALAKKLGATEFHPFMFVPTGKGKEISEYSLSAVEYETILSRINKLSKQDKSIRFNPTCAPQYNRIVLQNNPDNKRVGQGCMGGKSFAFISSTGDVQICGFLNMPAGNLRDHKNDFNDIWENSYLFKSLRDPANYKGKCGECLYHTVCGGCRARAYEENGDYLSDEPFCNFV